MSTLRSEYSWSTNPRDPELGKTARLLPEASGMGPGSGWRKTADSLGCRWEGLPGTICSITEPVSLPWEGTAPRRQTVHNLDLTFLPRTGDSSICALVSLSPTLKCVLPACSEMSQSLNIVWDDPREAPPLRECVVFSRVGPGSSLSPPRPAPLW